MEAYIFTSKKGLVFHSNKFWYNEKPCRIVYNNGSKSVLINGSKIGIKKLRKSAVKTEIETIKLPF